MSALLEGIRVLDLGQVYSGPYCGLLLAFMGAEVVKVEPPGGEVLRLGRAARENLALMMLNSSKKGIALDLKSPEGRELFLGLVRQADVLVENFAAGVMDRLGLGYEALRAANPRLVYASIKGYGSEGPYRDYPAMDFPIQAFAGIMAVTGYPDRPPVRAGVPVTDFLAGAHLLAGVLGALHHRQQTGEGQYVEVSLYDTAFPTLASALAGWFERGDDYRARSGNAYTGLDVAPYNAYEAVDGYVVILCLSDRHWQGLCQAMGRPELASDPRFASNVERARRREEVDALVGAWTAGLRRDAIFDKLREVHVPGAPVREPREVVRDPHLRARGIVL
ncbi:MAG: CoA transferase, partial [Clostridia bacterium]|nr:CoA transferase [Clostridia bacterium]